MKKRICLCMGSSCYTRGNREHLSLIQDWIEKESAGEFELSGNLCQGNCQNGPNIQFGDEIISIQGKEQLIEELHKLNQ